MAQERKKRRIVLASVLKPVDDARMFEKMGVSLAKSGQYEVFVIGFHTAALPINDNIQFISLPAFRRLSLQRVLAKWRVFQLLWRIKPDLLVFNTHELVFPSILLKVWFRTIIVYDVRENHFRNILHSGSFPWPIRWPLALLVRFKEKLLAPAIDHFFLAEKGYEEEIRFHRGGWTVIENKASALMEVKASPRHSPAGLKLLFSGTLAESTGVFLAIQLAKELHKLDTSVTLTIVGHAALMDALAKIQTEVQQNSFIQLIGGSDLVPHSTIVEHIQNSDFGIVSYPASSHTMNSHPTKVFEYLHYQLPIILDPRWPWLKRYLNCKPFVLFDFSKPDYSTLLTELRTGTFYKSSPEDVSWLSEEPRFLKALEKL